MLYVRTSGVSGMLYVHQVCHGCCTYIRCVRGVVRTSGVSGMLYINQVCQGCCTYIRCVRDVVRTSGVSEVLYVHQACCMYIRCVRDVVCISGVSGVLYVHQVCQGCCTYIRCVRDVMDGLYIIAMTLGRTHTMYTQDCTRYNITQCTVDSTTDYCYSIYMCYVHPVGQGVYLKATIMVKVCVICRHNNNMLQQNPNKHIMYTCAI